METTTDDTAQAQTAEPPPTTADAAATADAASAKPAPAGAAPKQQRSFSELALPVGNRLQLLVGTGGSQRIHTSMLIGYVDQHYLIVRQPQERGVSVALMAGEWLELRLFAGVHAIRFSCSVLRQLLPPLSQLLLSYPATVETMRLRRTPRAPVDLTAQLTAGDGAPIECRITDLSLQGAALQAPQLQAAVGSSGTLAFEFIVEADAPPVKLSTQVNFKSVKAAGPAGQVAGVQFGALAADIQAQLKTYIYEHLLQSYWRDS